MSHSVEIFRKAILEGIPNYLPSAKHYNANVNHAPRRKDILSIKEKKLALKNALRYFPKNLHQDLASEFLDELKRFGRIYMYRF
ncbi:MAG: urocanate hydratase, partial [Bacteroidetes bacterium]|nr:urocanate hydratase [Bacteroidota bacterium]